MLMTMIVMMKMGEYESDRVLLGLVNFEFSDGLKYLIMLGVSPSQNYQAMIYA